MSQDPINEGCLATIYRKFLGPLARFKPEGMTLQAWWEWLFHVSERSITQFKCRYAFRMPGLYHVAASVKIQGIGKRNVRFGDSIYVRMDTSNPNQVEVEWIPRRRRNGYWFTLTQSEWNHVATNLGPMPLRRRR